MSLIIHHRDLDRPEITPTVRQAMEACALASKLKVYMPILVGPHALGIAVEHEKATLLCEVYSPEGFQQCCEVGFKKQARFQIVEKPLHGKPAIWLRFKALETSFEVVGAPLPIEEQPDFLVTAVGHKLIQLSSSPHSARQSLLASRQVETTPESDSVQTPLAITLCEVFNIDFARAQGEAAAIKALTDLLDLDDAQWRAKFN